MCVHHICERACVRAWAPMKIDKMKEKQVVSSPACLGHHGNAPRQASRTLFTSTLTSSPPTPRHPRTSNSTHPSSTTATSKWRMQRTSPPATNLDIQPSRSISVSITLILGSVEEQERLDGIGSLLTSLLCRPYFLFFIHDLPQSLLVLHVEHLSHNSTSIFTSLPFSQTFAGCLVNYFTNTKAVRMGLRKW